MLHAYARVSTLDQDLSLQLDALRRAGAVRIWQERRSSAVHRPELVRMLYSLRIGDVVAVWKIDQLARSLTDLLHVVARIERAGATLRSLTEPLDTSMPIGRMMLQLLGAFAEFERSIIRERCAAGRAAAVARGVRMGRPREVDPVAITLLLQQGLTRNQVASVLGCHHSTVYRIVERERL